MSLTLEHAYRLLSKVEDYEAFILQDGRKISSLAELRRILDELPDHIWKHHVTKDRNDFSNWVKGVFHDDDLASKIAHSGNQKKAAATIHMLLSTVDEEVDGATSPKIEEKELDVLKEAPKVHHFAAKPITEELVEEAIQKKKATIKPIKTVEHDHEEMEMPNDINFNVSEAKSHEKSLSELLKQHDALEQKERKLLEIEQRIEDKYKGTVHSGGNSLLKEFLLGAVAGILLTLIICLVILKVVAPGLLPF